MPRLILYTGLKTQYTKMNINGYYNELRRTYGPNFVEEIKDGKKLGITLEKRKMQRKFLFDCKSSNVLPQHILNNCNINIRCFSKSVLTKMEFSILLFSKKILEHEITDTIQEIQYSQKQTSILKRNIINASTTDFFSQLYNRQLPTFNNIAFKTQITLNNKLKNLKITQSPKLITDKENWVVNISNRQIPENVLDIHSLGGKFNYNHTKKHYLLIKLSLILNTIYIIFQI